MENFFTGKEVFVVGGGFAAAEESVFLTKYARHVTILIREDGFTCAPAVAEPALHHEKITVVTHAQVEEVSGKDGLSFLRYRNTETGEVTEYRAADGDPFGVFVFAGYEPATDLVKGLADCDAQGYVVTDRNQKTTCEGLYAAGDVCIKPLRQVVTAVGDGALAATELERYAAALQKKDRPISRTAYDHIQRNAGSSEKQPADGWAVHSGYAVPTGGGISKNGFPTEAEALLGRYALVCGTEGIYG